MKMWSEKLKKNWPAAAHTNKSHFMTEKIRGLFKHKRGSIKYKQVGG